MLARYLLLSISLLAGRNVAAVEPPQPELTLYRAEVVPLIEKYCFDCHGSDDSDGNLSLQSLDPDLIHGDRQETWRIVDEQLRFGDMPPEDVEQPTAAERATVLNWIRGELLKTQMPGVVKDEKLFLPQFGNYVDHQYLFGERLARVYPVAPRIWRLRPALYDQKIRGTRLSENVGVLANGLSLSDGSELKDYAAVYFVDEAGTAPLLANAKKVAAAMLDPKQGRSKELKTLVSEPGPPDTAQIEHAMALVFTRALGRNPTAEEHSRFLTLYQDLISLGDHQVAAQSLITAILMQPEFFFRTELGDGQPDEFGRVRLTQKEIAYALSYALDDTPVDGFMKAAKSGKLSTNNEVAEAVRQQLNSASNPRILKFFREYFHYPFANEVFKDQPTEPEGAKHAPQMLVDDLEMTIRELVDRDEEVLANLLTTRAFYVNSKFETTKQGVRRLVQRDARDKKYQTCFNLPIDWKWGSHLQPVSFDDQDRAGVLTHPAWLAAWSGNFENHPVQRGKWIRTHLLGGTVPDVPIGVDARVPELENATFRERLRLATQTAECWRCHKKMDPLGVPFERYDHYGRLQRLDAGQPVDTSGIIDRTGVAELDGTEVGGPAELMEILAASEHVEQVFVRYAFRYFMGRNETLGDANTLQDAHQVYRDSGGSFNELVVSMLSSDSFLLRQLEPFFTVKRR